MGADSKIEWTDHTFNPWIGCTKVSAACDHCYAETLSKARLGVPWGKGEPRRRTTAENWKQPLRWNRKAEKEGRRMRVFCASLADVFDAEVSDEWRDELFALIALTPNLDWLLLTKRPRVAHDYLRTLGRHADVDRVSLAVRRRPDAAEFWYTMGNTGWHLKNVWLGTTVENQAMAEARIPWLLKAPAAKRFLSMEPLLGPVDLNGLALPPSWPRCDCKNHTPTLDALNATIYCPGCCEGPEAMNLGRIDWVIVGGESGGNARVTNGDWTRSTRDQCADAEVPFLFKQHGEWIDIRDLRNLPFGTGPGFGAYDHCRYNEEAESVRVGKKAAGRLLDGVEHNGFPA